MTNTDDSDTGNTPPVNEKTKQTRRAVACKSCHSLKVKCTPADEGSPSGPCLRCVRTNRVCEIDTTQTRKRRKTQSSVNPNDRITQLEDQVKQLTSQLQQQQKSAITSPSSSTSRRSLDVLEQPTTLSRSELERELKTLCSLEIMKLPELTSAVSSIADRRTDMLRQKGQVDCVTRGLLTLEEAEERLSLYRSKIYPRYKYVDIPSNLSARELRESQPYLFSAVMAMTSTVSPKELDIDKELEIDNLAIQGLTTEVLVTGTKSTELLKSLLLLCLWYNTPELFRHRRYHLINALCVSMIHDLGLSGRPYYVFSRDDGAVVRADAFAGPKGLENRKLVLVVYFSTISICLFLRRSVNVRWSQYIEDSCAILENSYDPDYRKIALFARLNHKLDRIHHIIHSVGHTEPLGMTNPRSKYVIDDFQRELNQIRVKIPAEDHAFLAYYFSVEAYLHEPSIGSIFSDSKTKKVGNLTPSVMLSLARCTSSCLSALNEYSLMSPEDVTSLPLFFSSRVIYTAGMLLRLRYLVLSLPESVEKNLVPTEVIDVIERVSKLTDEASRLYKSNFFTTKIRLVLSLFVQTYATQINELFKGFKKKNSTKSSPQATRSEVDTPGGSRSNAHTPHSQSASLPRLAATLSQHSPHLSELSANQPNHAPLEILSHAAAAHNQDEGNMNQVGVPNQETAPFSLNSPVQTAQRVQFPNFAGNEFPGTHPLIDSMDSTSSQNSVYPLPPATDFSSGFTGKIDPQTGLIVGPDSLEMSFWALNDEFWSDLLKTGSESLNFTSNINVSPNPTGFTDARFFQ